MVDADWLLQNLDKEDLVILDARNDKNYKEGHIPGAIHVPYEELFTAEGTMKSQEELEVLFSNAGLKKDDEIVTYCTAGIRSAHLAVVLHMAGYAKARNYDASFYTWAADQSLELE